MKSYLFISQRCPHSRTMMGFLATNDTAWDKESITVIDVDEVKDVPSSIRGVPSLWIDGELYTGGPNVRERLRLDAINKSKQEVHVPKPRDSPVRNSIHYGEDDIALHENLFSTSDEQIQHDNDKSNKKISDDEVQRQLEIRANDRSANVI